MLLASMGTDRMDRQTHTPTHTNIYIHTSHPHTKIKKKIKMARDCWEMQQGEGVWLASVSQALSSISSDRKRKQYLGRTIT